MFDSYMKSTDNNSIVIDDFLIYYVNKNNGLI